MSIFFNELLESIKLMDEVIKGQRVLSREHNIDAVQGNETRKAADLGVGAVNATHQPKSCFLMSNHGCVTFNHHVSGEIVSSVLSENSMLPADYGLLS